MQTHVLAHATGVSTVNTVSGGRSFRSEQVGEDAERHDDLFHQMEGEKARERAIC